MSIRVLIVDDIKLMRDALVEMIGKDKDIDEIATADNGLKALDLIPTFKPDVITLDVEMPVMDGLTALKIISDRRKNGEFDTNLKVVILSGTMFENDANARRARFFGADAVMAKPEGESFTLDINPHALVRIIKDLAA